MTNELLNSEEGAATDTPCTRESCLGSASRPSTGITATGLLVPAASTRKAATPVILEDRPHPATYIHPGTKVPETVLQSILGLPIGVIATGIAIGTETATEMLTMAAGANTIGCRRAGIEMFVIDHPKIVQSGSDRGTETEIGREEKGIEAIVIEEEMAITTHPQRLHTSPKLKVSETGQSIQVPQGRSTTTTV